MSGKQVNGQIAAGIDMQSVLSEKLDECSHSPGSGQLKSSRSTVSHHKNWKMAPQSPIARACTFLVDNQINLSASLLLLHYALHTLYPPIQHYTGKCFHLAYYRPEFDSYGQGWDDLFIVTYSTVVFTFLRAASMDYIFKPLAQYAGVRSSKGRVRFAEQAWLFVYPSISWSTGMYLVYHSDYWLNLEALWSNWPTREIPQLEKWFYLVQYGFWIQQILVVNIEERRKDYHQMFTHHIITCALIFASYGYHMTKPGTLILCMMDVVDILLPLAKMLKYAHLKTACDATFVLFMITWFFARHVLYLRIMWSTYLDLPRIITPGCYTGGTNHVKGPFPPPDQLMHLVRPFMEPEGIVCFTDGIRWGFLSMLGALQIITCMWFYMILRVAYKVIKGAGAEDSRSDDEDEDEDEDEEEEEKELEDEVKPINGSALAKQSANGTASAWSKPRKLSSGDPGGGGPGDGSASGIRLPGQMDRRELLGRIGCNSKTGGDS